MFWEAWDNFQFYHTFYNKFYLKFDLKTLPLLLPHPWCILYLIETELKVFRGLQIFWEGCEDLARISEQERQKKEHRHFGSRLLIYFSYFNYKIIWKRSLKIPKI